MEQVLGRQPLNQRIETEIEFSMRNLIRAKVQLVTACLDTCRVAAKSNDYAMTQDKFNCFSKCQIRLSYDQIDQE